MNKILRRISKLRKWQEKDLLSNSVIKAKEYLKSGNDDELKHLIKKLNGLYDTLSPQGQQISIDIVKRIMEAMKKT